MIIYSKLEDLMRFANTVREPYRGRFIELIKSVYLNISSMVYTNSLDDDEMIIYAMLLKLSYDLKVENKDKILRCISILLTR
jgi:hypothetical protein